MVRVSILDLLRDEILDGLVDFGDQLYVSFTLLILSSPGSLHFCDPYVGLAAPGHHTVLTVSPGL